MNLPVNTYLQHGKYLITRFIASGGFGCTYEAYHVDLGKRVAIKEFFVKDYCNRNPMTSEVTVATESKVKMIEKLKQKFMKEARTLAGLHHAGLVAVSDVFQENGTAYYVMDYVDGTCLANLIGSQGMPYAQAIAYIMQVADTLAYVHGKNLLHLDIKPQNIIIDNYGNAILIDFGTAKQYDEVNGENTSSLLAYTVGYAPPEQKANMITKFFPATDIYALGATLYKMLTGVTPPDSSAVISGMATLAPLPASVPPNIRQAVEVSMNPNISSRPQAIADFVYLINSAPPRPAEPTVSVNPEPQSKPRSQPRQKAQPKAKSKPRQRYTPQQKELIKENLKKAAIYGCLALLLFGIYKFLEHDDAKENITTVSGNIAGHDYVDLGLSVKWSTTNIGASSPSDYGDYFAWGETTTKPVYDDSEWGGLAYETLQSRNVIDSQGNLTSQYDAATRNWGSSWRMPTEAEIDELVNKCTWTWTVNGEQSGYNVTGSNGNSIFLPASGHLSGSNLQDVGKHGYYWSSTFGELDFASFLEFNSHEYTIIGCVVLVEGEYLGGLSIRPVTE